MKKVTVVGLMSVLLNVSAALPTGNWSYKDTNQNLNQIVPPNVPRDGNLDKLDIVGDGGNAVQRTKKSTVIANICVEVKPSLPDGKPYQLCETKDQKYVPPISLSESASSSAASSGLDTKYKPGYPQPDAKAGAPGYTKPVATPQSSYTSKYPYAGMYREASDSEQEASSGELEETSDLFSRDNARLPSTDLDDESHQNETPLLEENGSRENDNNMRTVHHVGDSFGNPYMNFKSFDKKKDLSNNYDFGGVAAPYQNGPGRYAPWGGNAYPSYKSTYPEQLYTKHKYQPIQIQPSYQTSNDGFMHTHSQSGTYNDNSKGLHSHPQYVQNPVYPTMYKPSLPSYQYPPHYPMSQTYPRPSYIQHHTSNALPFNGIPFSPYVPPPTYRMAPDEIVERKNLEDVEYGDINNRDGGRDFDGENPYVIDKEAATIEHMKKIAAARMPLFRNQQAPMNAMDEKGRNNEIQLKNSN